MLPNLYCLKLFNVIFLLQPAPAGLPAPAAPEPLTFPLSCGPSGGASGGVSGVPPLADSDPAAGACAGCTDSGPPAGAGCTDSGPPAGAGCTDSGPAAGASAATAAGAAGAECGKRAESPTSQGQSAVVQWS